MKKVFCIGFLFLSLAVYPQKYENGTRLLKGAEVMSATPLQLDYVLEKLADTAKITLNLHEGKTHLVLDDGSGEWREWWYIKGRWQLKNKSTSQTTQVNADWEATSGVAKILNKPNIPPAYTLPVATSSVLGGVKKGDRITIVTDGTISADKQVLDYSSNEQKLGINWCNGMPVYRKCWNMGNMSSTASLDVGNDIIGIIEITGTVSSDPHNDSDPIYTIGFNDGTVYVRAYYKNGIIYVQQNLGTPAKINVVATYFKAF